VKLMLSKDIKVKNSKVLVLGITFKENCPDVRNTKVVDVIQHLKGYGTTIDIYDPWVSPEEVMKEYGLLCMDTIPSNKYDGIVLAVAHQEFLELELEGLKNKEAVVYDVKGILAEADSRL
jgi:UDP-N-acetyl-D-galactosamine dehydrogenase